MISRRVVFVLLVGVSLSSLSGCAAFRTGEFMHPASWPLATTLGKQSISLLVTGEALVNGMRQDLPQRMIQRWQDAATRAYKDSGLFSDVKTGAAETDLRAEVHVLERGEANQGMAFLSGLTLTLAPAHAESEFVVKTMLKNKEGQDLGTFEKKETLSMWIQFFLIFIMPFNWPNTVAADMFYDLHRATISQAYGAGLLQAGHVTGPIHWAHVAQ
ncbi:MAG: hypothetical protein WCH20_08295 [Nitrospira sp.]